MRFDKVFAAARAAAHAEGALLSRGEGLEFFEASKLPECTRTCTTLLSAISPCGPVPIGSIAPWLACFCSHQELRSESLASTMCSDTCNQSNRTVVEKFYVHVCRYEEAIWSSAHLGSTPVPVSETASTCSPTLVTASTSSPTLTTTTTPSRTLVVIANTPSPTIASILPPSPTATFTSSTKPILTVPTTEIQPRPTVTFVAGEPQEDSERGESW